MAFKWLTKRRGNPAPLAAAPNILPILEQADAYSRSQDYSSMLVLLQAHEKQFSRDARLFASMGFAYFMLARYQEAAAAFEQALVFEPANVTALKFLVGALYFTEEYAKGIDIGARAIAAGCADEQVYNALGAIHLNLGQLGESLNAFETAIRINPSDTQALANIEAVKSRFSAIGAQEAGSSVVTETRDAWISTYTERFRNGTLTVGEAERLSQLIGAGKQTWHLAIDLVERFMSRDDLTATLAANLSTTCLYAGRTEDGLRLMELAFKLSPALPEVRNGLGYRLVRQGGTRWIEGWRLMAETNRKFNPNNYPKTALLWTGQPLGNKRLFVHFDQGVGDALMALRFVPILAGRGINVVLWVLPAMTSLLTALEPFADIVHSPHMPDPSALGCDYACGLFDLVAGLNVGEGEIAHFPRIWVDDARIAHWRSELGTFNGPVLGLIASGNPRRMDDWIRTVPPERLAALKRLGNVRWINLSTDPRPEVEASIRLLNMADPTPRFSNFADTAAVMSLVDGVIAIDSAGAHLAGALGRPLWVLKPTMDDWRWQIGDTLSPWWPEARVFAATSAGEWHDVIPRLTDDVEDYLRSKYPGGGEFER
jgi:tetratricopeptide (TPR) repeat protein